MNDELKKQIEGMGQDKQFQDRIRQLEDEKNALLDYIEENIEKSTSSPLVPQQPAGSGSRQPREGGDHISEVNRLSQMNEGLKLQEKVLR